MTVQPLAPVSASVHSKTISGALEFLKQFSVESAVLLCADALIGKPFSS